MANPNIALSTAIYGKSNGLQLTTGFQTLLTATTSNSINKVNSIIVANRSGSSAADVTILWRDSSAGTDYYLAYTITVPADATLVVLSKDTQIYLEENDYIQAQASANGVLDVTISYEQIYA